MRNLITFDTVRQIALALPEVEDSTSYGTPALKVRRKLIIRLKEDGEKIVVKVDFDEREELIAQIRNRSTSQSTTEAIPGCSSDSH